MAVHSSDVSGPGHVLAPSPLVFNYSCCDFLKGVTIELSEEIKLLSDQGYNNWSSAIVLLIEHMYYVIHCPRARLCSSIISSS